MGYLEVTKTYDRSSIYLKPKASFVNSRDEVDLSVDILNKLRLSIPIIASPMRGIINPILIRKMDEWGGIGILHRFCDDKEFLSNLESVSGCSFGVAVGLNEFDRVKLAVEFSASLICVDVANGYLQSVKTFCAKIKDKYPDILLMSGNVVDYEGTKSLNDHGVDLIRVGIGTGNLCRTRQKTKIGFGQFSALLDCSNADGYIVSDGGIKEPGDAVLDLAAGADLIMIGSLLAQTFESAHNGKIFGMASRTNQEEYHHSVKSVEGIEESVQKTMSFDNFISEFLYGMKSSFTYQDAKNIRELRENAEFVEIL
ncbi:MAG: IMP dehydrogenase, partial [Nitrososphaera sp.]